MLICGHYVRAYQDFSLTNPDIPAPKYDGTIEIKVTNEFFELMKKKHKKLVISESGLFLDKTNCFIGASPDHLMTCDC